MPGTTRDLISEYTNLEGIPVSLQDTAGIHDSADHVEKLGMDRSLRAMVDADVILFVLDQSQRLSEQDEALKKKLEGLSCIVVMNKSDLSSKWSSAEKAEWAGSRPYVDVSAKTGAGIAGLRHTIISRITGGDGVGLEGILVTNLRHYQNLDAAGKSLRKAASALKEGLSEEFALLDLHRALHELGAITGEVSVEDLLGEIFSRFCIGK
jgi:tRNA modification GTPase